jgi:hypothetical protein
MIRKIVVGGIIGIMICFMLSVLLQGLVEKFHINGRFAKFVLNEEDNLPKKKSININWRELYPFQDSITEVNENVKINALNGRYLGEVNNAKEHISDRLTDKLLCRIRFVEMANYYEGILGWWETIYDLGDGWLTEVLEKKDMHLYAISIEELNEYLKKLDIDFLYIQCPYKICKKDLIAKNFDFSNENADNLLNVLSLKKIPFLDLRENIHEENLDHHSLFYKTDHHWKAETGLWATKIIARNLNEQFGFEIDLNLFDPARYRFDVYKNWFLGSYRKKNYFRTD